MTEEFDVSKTIEYLKKIGITDVSEAPRNKYSEQMNRVLSCHDNKFSRTISYFPDVIGCVAGKMFLAEIKTRKLEHTTSGRFTINEEARKAYFEIQDMFELPIIIICEDLPYIGGNFLDKLPENKLINDKYRFINESDLINLSPLLWKIYPNIV